MSRRIPAFSTLILAVLFVVLPGYLLYSRWERARLLPSELRYMPPDTGVLVGIGDIGSFWDGIEFHFGRVLKDPGRKGFLATELEDLRAKLADKELSVRTKQDLICHHGLDIDRGVLVGLSVMDFASVMVVPVASEGAVVDKYCHQGVADPQDPSHAASEEKVVNFLCALFCPEDWSPILLRYQRKAEDDPCNSSILLAEGRKDPSWFMDDHAYDLGSRVLVFPRPDTAVLSPSCELLHRALAEQERNLSYARADDELFEAVRYQLRRPLLSGPGALLYARGLSTPSFFGPVGSVTASINLVPDAVTGDLRLRTAEAHARVIDDLLAPPKTERTWRKFFGAEDAAVFVLRDDSLQRYFDSASDNPYLDANLRTFLGGILEPARQLDHLDQIVLGVADYRDGMPVLTLGMWGSREELASLASKTQRHLYNTRFEKLVQGARQKGEAVKISPLTPAHVNGPEYLETYKGYKIRYLEPPVTGDDLKYRLSVDPEEGRILLENRYRLASTITGDILWVSRGRQPLHRIIDRLGNAKAGNGFRLGVESDAQENKLRVLANSTALIREGMLSGESTLQDITERFLLDFRYHKTITVSLKPTGNGQELRLEFGAYGRSRSDAIE